MTEHIIEEAPNKPGRKAMSPLLKFALELGPLLVFFFANARADDLVSAFPALQQLGGPLFVATGLFMAATVIALTVSWAMTRSLPIMPLVSGFFVVVFGALTLWLQDETFIKMKPTIVNLLFAAVLLGGLCFGKSLLGYVFDQAFRLDDEGWRKLTLRWGLFFIFLAILNEGVWRGANYWYGIDAHSPKELKETADFVWTNFKVWGTMPITVAFMLTQLPLIKRHSIEPIGLKKE
ncbi:septation protein A [Jiella endophytica]|uniref:Inner membrane-spanning protein YciB n=1 Tax=Jiella endophytica TaxID=2558362 RepID=A0A4Y8RGQ2_9HYPH|nr:septation protein A [Jiella endophytica]TFF21661.1 septation protein A [Jiella endophytica]